MKKKITVHSVPLRDIVIFPNIVTPLFIGRKHSIAAVEAARDDDMQLLLVSQKRQDVEQPTADDVYDIGTLADIMQVMELPDGTLKLLVQGKSRAKIHAFTNEFLTQCEAEVIKETLDVPKADKSSTVLMLLNAFESYLKRTQKHSRELLTSVADIDSVALMTDVIASHLQVNVEKKMTILAEAAIQHRIEKVSQLLMGEMDLIDLEKQIQNRVKSQMNQNHKEYYLNEQAKAIQKELEELDETKSEYGQLTQRIIDAKMPELVEKKCLSELDKLKRMSASSPEAIVIRTYLDHLIDYPWSKQSQTRDSVTEAADILEASHFGLEEVKKRIVEYIAVQQRLKKPSGSILCLVGPPGVGKTSIGKSIAQAVNREYVRVALGGVRDEAEIRGHRRTYIGALPGKIVQNITKSGVNNPLFLLDEIDKMGNDYRGDPASAMLEVLDPEQNHAFNDHYMEVDVDLSNVMFVATANSLNIPEPLLDRMEVIRIPGYTESEKMAIAKQYLIPRNIERAGLKSKEFSLTDSALKAIVEGYTREAGVRRLDREIAKLCRKVVTAIALEGISKVSVSKKNLTKYLGVEKYQREALHNKDAVGRINGLAWTSVGGELLNIEVAVLAGKGKISLTGKIGDVMKESVEAAMTVIKSYAMDLGIEHTFFQEHDFHIHFPEAATPKDGPSAGTAIVIALLSAVLQAPISRHIAMTGEVTLQGRVLAIGGLKEKLFAAVREGIQTVFIPMSNQKDLEEISDEIKQALEIIPVSHVDEVIAAVFPNHLNKIEKPRKNKLLTAKYWKRETESSRQH